MSISFSIKDFIAEFLCINKDKPEMQCHGQCFLMQSLEQNHEQEQELPLYLILEDRIPVVYLPDNQTRLQAP